MPKIPPTPAEPSEAEVAAALEADRLRNMNSLQWLTLQAERGLERGLDALLGPATEEALRPAANEARRVPNRVGEANSAAADAVAGREPRRRRRRETPVRPDAVLLSRRQAEAAALAALTAPKEPSDWAKAAAAKRRALEILDIEREEEEWEAQKKRVAAENAQSILQNTLVQVGGLYAVSQACVLSVFVPQKCPAILGCVDYGDAEGNGRVPANCLWSPWFKYPYDEPAGHLCSMKENIDWNNFTQRNKDVFLMNACTLALMLTAQAYFWKREVWMITHLSEDNNIPYNNLPTELARYKEFVILVAGFNRGAYYFACAVMLFVVINFGMTTDFLINGDEVYNYNLGTRTITGLLTNTMLVSTKVIGYLSYSRLSYVNEWAISMFSVVPLSYNVVDEMQREREVRKLSPLDFSEEGAGAA